MSNSRNSDALLLKCIKAQEKCCLALRAIQDDIKAGKYDRDKYHAALMHRTWSDQYLAEFHELTGGRFKS